MNLNNNNNSRFNNNTSFGRHTQPGHTQPGNSFLEFMNGGVSHGSGSKPRLNLKTMGGHGQGMQIVERVLDCVKGSQLLPEWVSGWTVWTQNCVIKKDLEEDYINLFEVLFNFGTGKMVFYDEDWITLYMLHHKDLLEINSKEALSGEKLTVFRILSKAVESINTDQTNVKPVKLRKVEAVPVEDENDPMAVVEGVKDKKVESDFAVPALKQKARIVHADNIVSSLYEEVSNVAQKCLDSLGFESLESLQKRESNKTKEIERWDGSVVNFTGELDNTIRSKMTVCNPIEFAVNKLTKDEGEVVRLKNMIGCVEQGDFNKENIADILTGKKSVRSLSPASLIFLYELIDMLDDASVHSKNIGRRELYGKMAEVLWRKSARCYGLGCEKIDFTYLVRRFVKVYLVPVCERNVSRYARDDSGQVYSTFHDPVNHFLRLIHGTGLGNKHTLDQIIGLFVDGRVVTAGGSINQGNDALNEVLKEASFNRKNPLKMDFFYKWVLSGLAYIMAKDYNDVKQWSVKALVFASGNWANFEDFSRLQLTQEAKEEANNFAERLWTKCMEMSRNKKHHFDYTGLMMRFIRVYLVPIFEGNKERYAKDVYGDVYPCFDEAVYHFAGLNGNLGEQGELSNEAVMALFESAGLFKKNGGGVTKNPYLDASLRIACTKKVPTVPDFTLWLYKNAKDLGDEDIGSEASTVSLEGHVVPEFGKSVGYREIARQCLERLKFTKEYKVAQRELTESVLTKILEGDQELSELKRNTLEYLTELMIVLEKMGHESKDPVYKKDIVLATEQLWSDCLMNMEAIGVEELDILSRTAMLRWVRVYLLPVYLKLEDKYGEDSSGRVYTTFNAVVRHILTDKNGEDYFKKEHVFVVDEFTSLLKLSGLFDDEGGYVVDNFDLLCSLHEAAVTLGCDRVPDMDEFWKWFVENYLKLPASLNKMEKPTVKREVRVEVKPALVENIELGNELTEEDREFVRENVLGRMSSTEKLAFLDKLPKRGISPEFLNNSDLAARLLSNEHLPYLPTDNEFLEEPSLDIFSGNSGRNHGSGGRNPRHHGNRLGLNMQKLREEEQLRMAIEASLKETTTNGKEEVEDVPTSAPQGLPQEMSEEEQLRILLERSINDY